MIPLQEILALGLLMGVRHAFDADHLVAVTTIVSEYRSPLRAIWIGTSWGLGHTTTLLILGALILFLGLQIPERLSLFFEFLVGIMLVLLGIQTFWILRRRRIHFHSHHEPQSHAHFHSHSAISDHSHHKSGRWNNLSQIIAGIIPPSHHLSDKPGGSRKPFFRLKSYLVGTIHGLAGSAALMLLLLSSMESTLAGALYILVFGLGSVISMGIVSIFISLPLAISSRLPTLNRVIQASAGIFSIAFGILLMYHVWITNGLFTHS